MKRSVVITGAAGALGSDVARHLSSLGFSLGLVDSAHAADRLHTMADELASPWAAFDVGDSHAWETEAPKLEKALSQGGAPIFGAVLIAGAWKGGAPIHQEEDATWRAMMSANVETAHATMRALVPGMVARNAGSIVVIGSRAAVQPWTSAGSAAYAASKAAVVALAQAAAAELVENNVRVNAVLPSTMDTPMNRKSMPKADPARWVSTMSAAKVIAFLLSDDAKDVSGAALPLYGRS
jgi:NAD(P)-dependent dehydrogenase (short-subunit alcohol dehydrogenase family)